MDLHFKDIEYNLDIFNDKQVEISEESEYTTSLGEATELDDSNHQITIEEYIVSLEEEKKRLEEEKKRLEEEKKKQIKLENKYSPFMKATIERDNRILEEEMEKLKKIDPEFPFVQKPLNTNAELRLFNFIRDNIILKEAVVVLTMVRIADFIEINKLFSKYKDDSDAQYKSRKMRGMHIDFLICRADNLKIICAYELDDYTHESYERKQVDAFKINVLQSAGIKLLRYVKRIADITQSDLYDLNILIGNEFAPKCPECGKPMVTKQGIKDKKYFYACFDNIYCRHTQEINSKEDI